MRNPLVYLIFLLVFISSCDFIGGERVRGNGNVTTTDRELSNFDGVRTSGSFDAVITTGNDYQVKVEADENLHEYIETVIEDNVLGVKTKKGYNISASNGLKVYITAPNYRVVRISGSGSFNGRNKIVSNSSMDIGISGSGDINLDIDSPQTNAEISGSGTIKLKGETETLKAGINGGGDIRALDLRSENVTIDINGSGEVDVFASVNLAVNVRGSGDVRYKGGANVKSDIKGSGDVVKVD